MSGRAIVNRRRGAFIWVLAMVLAVASASSLRAEAGSITLVVLGDSLTAGFGLAPKEAFPEKLEIALKARGFEVEVVNAGVSGDTSAGGLARVDWSVGANTDAVIIELGANDALRGIAPSETRENLSALISNLRDRGIAVLLAGMLAPRNLDDDYIAAFDRIYPDLASQHDVPLHPFFLEGVAADPTLNQPDGIHPNTQGVDVVVEGILPAVEALLSGLDATGG